MADEDPLQNIHNIHLTFRGETVSGSGYDVVGRFTMMGTVADGRVEVIKQYVGAHTVIYYGNINSAGCIVGRWKIYPYDGGGFLWVPPGIDSEAVVQRWVRESRRG